MRKQLRKRGGFYFKGDLNSRWCLLRVYLGTLWRGESMEVSLLDQLFTAHSLPREVNTNFLLLNSPVNMIKYHTEGRTAILSQP